MPDSAPVDAAGVAFASPGAPNTPSTATMARVLMRIGTF